MSLPNLHNPCAARVCSKSWLSLAWWVCFTLLRPAGAATACCRPGRSKTAGAGGAAWPWLQTRWPSRWGISCSTPAQAWCSRAATVSWETPTAVAASALTAAPAARSAAARGKARCPRSPSMAAASCTLGCAHARPQCWICAGSWRQLGTPCLPGTPLPCSMLPAGQQS